MPEIAQWPLLVGMGLCTAAAIAWPLLSSSSSSAPPERISDAGAEAEARALRHRVALDALLDVEADRRAGLLDDASYRRECSEAEARAAQTLAEATDVTAVPETATPLPATPMSATRAHSRRVAVWLGAGLAAALLVGFALPPPTGLAERTVVNQALADELARETARQAEIQRLLGSLSANPRDAHVLSELADAYLAGDAADDLQRAAVALQLLLGVEPENRSAYRRLVSAYISAADWWDAQAATESYATVAAPDEPEIPFLRGLIAFRSGDSATAMWQFDRFLALAPDDDRAPMVTSLRAEAAGQLTGASPSPGG